MKVLPGLNVKGSSIGSGIPQSCRAKLAITYLAWCVFKSHTSYAELIIVDGGSLIY